MATYLNFHKLERSPFEGQMSDQLVLATASLRHAYAQVKAGLKADSPRICLSGGSGIGKSSFARALPKLLESEARCVLVRDPGTEWSQIKASIAKQLHLEGGQVSRSSLVDARQDGRRVVLVIDRAEDLTAESLEHLDVLLGYRDDEGGQLVQCVLLANLEEAPRGREIQLLWWLDQLTTRQLRFSPIPREGIRSYVDKHLTKAGFRGASPFSDDAVTAIYRYTGGVPGAVSALCEQLLARAAEQRRHEIDGALVAAVCGDELSLEEATTDDGRDLHPLREAEPAPARKPRAEAALPQFGERRGAAGRANPFAESEPALKVEQGLVHMDEPERPAAASVFADLMDDDPFASLRPTRHESRPRQELPRHVANLSPGSGRSGRFVRNLIGLAVLACLAMVVHLVFFAGQPAVPRFTKRIPPPTALLKSDPVKSEIEGSSDAPVPEVVFGPKEPKIAVAEDLAPEIPFGPQEPEGLTSDLRLDPSTTNAAALAEHAGPVGERREGDEASSLSLGKLYELADKADPEPEVFEPWAEEAPEPAEAPESAPSPSPAAPAPRR